MDFVVCQTIFIIAVLCFVTTDALPLYITDEYYPDYNTQLFAEDLEPLSMDAKRSEVAPENEMDEWIRGDMFDARDHRLMNLMQVKRRGGNFPFNSRRGRLNNIIPFYSHKDGINYYGNQDNSLPTRLMVPSTSLYGLRRHPNSIFGEYLKRYSRDYL